MLRAQTGPKRKSSRQHDCNGGNGKCDEEKTCTPFFYAKPTVERPLMTCCSFCCALVFFLVVSFCCCCPVCSGALTLLHCLDRLDTMCRLYEAVHSAVALQCIIPARAACAACSSLLHYAVQVVIMVVDCVVSSLPCNGCL